MVRRKNGWLCDRRVREDYPSHEFLLLLSHMAAAVFNSGTYDLNFFCHWCWWLYWPMPDFFLSFYYALQCCSHLLKFFKWYLICGSIKIVCFVLLGFFSFSFQSSPLPLWPINFLYFTTALLHTFPGSVHPRQWVTSYFTPLVSFGFLLTIHFYASPALKH